MASQSGSSGGSPGYRKELGLFSVVFLATGAILGPAIGFTPVSVLAFAGPSGILSWPIAFILIMAVAMSYVELGTMWPRAGGVAYYPARSNGPVVGVMNAWGSLVGYSLAVPSIVVAFVEYLSYWFPGLMSHGGLSVGGIIASVVVLLTVFYINTLRIRIMGTLNNIFTIVTIVGLLIVIVALFGHFHSQNFGAFGGFAPLGTSGLFIAISATIYGYGGFRQPIDYAEEVRDPGKTIPKAVAITMVVTLIIYFLESTAFTGAIDWKAMSLHSGGWASLGGLGYPFLTVSQGEGLAIIGILAIITTLIATYKDGYIYFGGASRVGYALAKYDSYLPEYFTRMTANGIPRASVVLVLVVSILYIVLLPAFSSLFPLVVGALLLSYAPGPLSLAVFRTKYPDLARPYVMPAYKVLAPFAFVVSSLMIYWSGWASVHILIPSTFIGLLLLFFYNNRKRKLTAADVAQGIWFPIFQLVLLVVSYFGSTDFGGNNALIFPWDSVVMALVALAFYYWGYASGLRYTTSPTFSSDHGESASA